MGKKGRNYEELIDYAKLPRHIAIIMDGNGRWAHKRFLPRTMGHRSGMATLKTIVKTSARIGMPILTVFAFSTENWKRPDEEVSYLMRLLVEFIDKELQELNENKVHINILGDYTKLPSACQKSINKAIQTTSQNQGLIFNIAINYGARSEIIAAVNHLVDDIMDGKIKGKVDESLFASYLYTKGLPDPDLLIRTAGEMRISNFLLWQIAYAEFWVTDKMWPEFSEDDFLKAIWEYQQRERRFGGIDANRRDGYDA